MNRRRRLHDDAQLRWAAIVAKLQPHAAELARQGSLSSRRAWGRRVWSVRFVDRTGPAEIQRTVYLGDDPQLISRVRELLAEWRAEGQLAADGLALARQINGLCTSLNRVIGRPHRPKRLVQEERQLVQ